MTLIDKTKEDIMFIAHSLGRDFEASSSKVSRFILFNELCQLMNDYDSYKAEIKKAFQKGKEEESGQI